MPISRKIMGVSSGSVSKKAIFGYGHVQNGGRTAITNLVSNTGVVSSDTAGVGSVRGYLAACGYGTDKGIFGFGTITFYTSITNLISNIGVVSTDVAGVGSGQQTCSYDGIMPIAVPRSDNTHTLETFTASIVPDSPVPGLLGLESMTNKRTIIDTVKKISS